VQESTAAPALPAFSTIAGVDLSGTSRIVMRDHRVLVNRRALRARKLARQHFLKWEAVFFAVLVYSVCRASRFPNAHSD
jgi:hypothetical protein